MHSAKIQDIERDYLDMSIVNKIFERPRKSHDASTHFRRCDSKMMSDLECEMYSSAKPSFFTTSCRHGQNVQEQIDIFDDALRSEEQGLQSISEHGTKLVPESFSQF